MLHQRRSMRFTMRHYVSTKLAFARFADQCIDLLVTEIQDIPHTAQREGQLGQGTQGWWKILFHSVCWHTSSRLDPALTVSEEIKLPLSRSLFHQSGNRARESALLLPMLIALIFGCQKLSSLR